MKITHISRYEVISLLGQGGLGVVYKARDPSLDKIVAIKLIGNQKVSEDQALRFQREAKALKDLRHAAIPEIYNFAISKDDTPYMVMEYLEGTGLDSLIENCSVQPVETIVEIGTQLCRALSYAHSHGIVHRDVKPSNVILAECEDGSWRVKLVDFGIARLEETFRDRQELTETGALIGSPPYMSPEQIRALEIDGRSDIYSLGCVLYEMLTGEPPFSSTTPLAIVGMHLADRPPAPSSLVDLGNHLWLDDVLLKCLAKDPAERYATARDLEADLTSNMARIREETAQSAKQHERREAEDQSTVEDESGKDLAKSIHRLWISTAFLAILIVFVGAFSFKLFFSPDEKQTAHTNGSAQESMVKNNRINEENVLGYNEHETWRLTSGKNPVVIGTSHVTDDDFAKIAQSYKSIHRFKSRMSSRVTGKGFKYLRGMYLTSVDISSPNLSDEGLKELSRVKSVASLKIMEFGKVTDRGIRELAKLPELSYFHVTGRLPAGFFDAISTVKSLTSLEVDSIYQPIKDEDLKKLKALPRLRKLRLGGSIKSDNESGIRSSQLPLLKDLRHLEILVLARVSFDDSGLKKLAQVPQIRFLVLKHLPITDTGLAFLAQSKNLKSIDLEDCRGITKAGIEAFKRKNPHCKIKRIHKFAF